MRINRSITVVAGTPINVATGLSTAATANDKLMVNRVSCQMKHGGTGYGLVLGGIVAGRIPAAANSLDLTWEMGPAGATAPGGSWSDDDGTRGIDLSTIWVDGSNSGDKILVSYDQRV
jgi:hypothetical protein